MTEDQWTAYCNRSKMWSIRIGYDLLHSHAYRNLNYGPAIKVLNWFHEKLKYEKDKKKRGKNRYRLINDGEISFTYKEAGQRGLTDQKFRRALIELHHLGFIDVTHPGSGLKGDYTKFAISDRWRDFGTDKFKSIKLPQSVFCGSFGYRKRKSIYENSSLSNNENSLLEITSNDENSSLKGTFAEPSQR
jgi:hypothetical protein